MDAMGKVCAGFGTTARDRYADAGRRDAEMNTTSTTRTISTTTTTRLDFTRFRGRARGRSTVGARQNDPYLRTVEQVREDDFEPMVYTREPDDLDEYSFFSGARFGQLGRVKRRGRRSRNASTLSVPRTFRRSRTECSAATTRVVRRARHVLLADQAGSGKTLAYLLPLLQRVQKSRNRRVEANRENRDCWY